MLRILLASLLLTATGCDSLSNPDESARIHLQGSVTAASTGAPLSMATVELRQQRLDSRAVLEVVQADSAGHYELEHVIEICAASLLDLHASSPGRVSRTYAWAGDDGPTHVRCTDDVQQIDFALELP